MNRDGAVTRRLCLCGLAVAPLVGATVPVRSPPAEIARHLPSARLSGHATLRFMGLAIYDIRLWTTAPLRADDIAQHPFGLELEYARALAGQRIAQRSIDEMRQVGSPTAEQTQRWLAALQRLFPDVEAGDRLTGLQAGGRTVFFHNGRELGTVDDVEFGRLFFGIWLAPTTSVPGLREQLLDLRGRSDRADGVR